MITKLLLLPGQSFPAFVMAGGSRVVSLDDHAIECSVAMHEDRTHVDADGLGRFAVLIRIECVWEGDEERLLSAPEVMAFVSARPDLAHDLDALLTDDACGRAEQAAEMAWEVAS